MTMTMTGVRARATRQYTMAYSDPLALEQNECVVVLAHDTEWPAFVWCTSASGKGGWVPESYLRILGGEGWALRPYSARELTVAAGEELLLLDEEGGWFWAENALGEQGWVPAQHIAAL